MTIITRLIFTLFLAFCWLSNSSCKKAAVKVDDTQPKPAAPAAPVSQAAADVPVFSHLETDSASQTIFLYTPVSSPKYLLASRGWQGVPTIERYNNELFASWYTGPTGEQLGNYLVVATSTDDGKSWAQNQLIIAPDNDNSRLFDQSFWKDSFGNLHMSWSISTGFVYNGPTLRVWHIMLKRDASGQIVITRPAMLFSGMMACKPTLVGQDGASMYYPVYGANVATTAASVNSPSDYNGAFLYKATVNGNSMTSPVKVAKINLDNSIRSYDEHMIVAIDDLNFICAFRTTQGIYTANSKDAGVTWDTPKKLTSIGASTEVRSYFGKLKSGNLLLVTNNSTTREKMTAFLSKDGGKTWPYSLMIDKRVGNSYPDVTEDNNGNIYVIFDYGRSPYGQILMAKITENDIINPVAAAVPLTVISKIK